MNKCNGEGGLDWLTIYYKIEKIKFQEESM